MQVAGDGCHSDVRLQAPPLCLIPLQLLRVGPRRDIRPFKLTDTYTARSQCKVPNVVMDMRNNMTSIQPGFFDYVTRKYFIFIFS
jgi:hypothetical protein